MSNPDLPGAYWQDQDDSGYGSGWRTGPPRAESAWDDGSGFWRGDRNPGRDERDSRQQRHQAPRNADSPRPARGSRRAGTAGGRASGGRASGGGAASGKADGDRSDWTGRFSQTADDLRNKLGLRGRAGGPGDEDFWAEPVARRAGSSARGSRSRGDSGPRRALRAVVGGDFGPGDYGPGDYGPGDYGPGDYGPGDYGSDGQPAVGRTALREPADRFWGESDRSTRGLRSKIAERPFTRGGGSGNGGGRGGGGPGGGRSPGGDPRSRGKGFRNWLLYGRWWRHWTWKKALGVAGAGVAVCILLGIAGFFILYEMTPVPTANELTADWQSSTVYFANGKQMGTFDDNVNGVTVDRMLLTPAQIPTVMTQAMTAAEDRHFYTEGGVSLTGLMRAAYEDVSGNGNLQGGSTITMQYAKNYYSGVDTGRNVSTKLKEIFIAMKLGHDRSKQWVMTNYLNTVPFGATIDGLGAAAESYFDINLTQPRTTLTIAQAAMLAAMPNNPAVFSSALEGSDPAGLTALKARFSYVINNMVRDGNITPAQAAQATFPKLTPPPAGNGETGYTGYLMNMVEQQLEAPYADGGYALTQHEVDTGGYKIRTTFSMAMVKALARAVNAEKQQMKSLAAEEGATSFRNYDRIGAVLENSKTGAIVAIYGGPGYLSSTKRCNAVDCWINNAESAQPVGSSFKPYVLATAVNENMNVFTSKLNGYSPIWIPLSSPGGTTATQQMLSPTSVPRGCSAQASVCFVPNGPDYFKFDESDENSGRPLPVNVAAAISSDPAFEDLAHRDGINNVIAMAKAFGVGQNAFVAPCASSNGGDDVAQTIAACNDYSGPGYKSGGTWYPGHGLYKNFSPDSTDKGAEAAGTRGSPAIALGENPLTPIEQATTFATLADDGLYHTPTVIKSVTRNGATVASHLQKVQVLSPPAAADVDYALSFDNNMGGGTADVNVPFRRGDVIAKTGTLGSGADASEAWFIGATPDQYALSVALFTNDPGTQNLDNLPSVGGTPGSQGGGWPASTWNEFMTSNLNNIATIPLSTFPEDQGAPFVPWIQVHAKKTKPTKPICKPGGHTQNCTCPQNAPWCAHPNPGQSCQPGFGIGQCTSPSPTPTCQGFGQSCASPSPTPSVTPSVSASATCTPSPGSPCGFTARTTAYIRSSPSSGVSIVLAAEDTSSRLAASRLAAALGLVA